MNGCGLYHLCLTHSPLVTWVFQAAMAELEIAPEWVCSISRRSVRPAGPGVCLDDLSDQMEVCYKKFDRAGYGRLRRQLSGQLAELTHGGEFLAYIPHTQRIFYQEVISHPSCRGYLFVEEGFTSMSWQSRRGLKLVFSKRIQYALRRWWSQSNYRPDRPMFDSTSERYLGAIAISDHAFAGMPNLINVAKKISRFGHQAQERRLFVVLDTSYLHRGIRWENYEDALVASIVETAAVGTSIFVKFHFADPLAVERFASLGQRVSAVDGGAMTLLARDYSIEEHLTGNDCVLFGVTSLGYYAALFGAAVKCFAPQVEGLDLDQWIGDGALPPDFREIVGINRDAGGIAAY